MSALLFVALAQAIAAPPAPPPPVVVASAYRDKQRDEIMTFDVEAKAGNAILWSGVMRVSQRQPANMNRQETNALAVPCENSPSPYGGARERSSFSINLNAYRMGMGQSGVQMSASWERPSDARDCQGPTTRTVGVAETITLEPGREQIVKGDGGLTVRLRRQ